MTHRRSGRRRPWPRPGGCRSEPPGVARLPGDSGQAHLHYKTKVYLWNLQRKRIPTTKDYSHQDIDRQKKAENKSQKRAEYIVNKRIQEKKPGRAKEKRTKQPYAEFEKIDRYDYLNSPPASVVAEGGPRVKSSGLNGGNVPGSTLLDILASWALQTVNVTKQKKPTVCHRRNWRVERERKRKRNKSWSNRPSSFYLKQE